MTAEIIINRESQAGYKARRLRLEKRLTQRELASLAGVSRAAVALFERDLPLPLDHKRRILRELWAKKTGSGEKSATPCV